MRRRAILFVCLVLVFGAWGSVRHAQDNALELARARLAGGARIGDAARRQAAAIVATDPRLARALSEELADSPAWTQRLAGLFLEEAMGRSVIDRPALQDRSWVVRRAALRRLVQEPPELAAAALLPLLEDRIASVRLVAAEVAAGLGIAISPALEAALLRLDSDSDGEVRLAARDALVRLPVPSAERLGWLGNLVRGFSWPGDLTELRGWLLLEHEARLGRWQVPEGPLGSIHDPLASLFNLASAPSVRRVENLRYLLERTPRRGVLLAEVTHRLVEGLLEDDFLEAALIRRAEVGEGAGALVRAALESAEQSPWGSAAVRRVLVEPFVTIDAPMAPRALAVLEVCLGDDLAPALDAFLAGMSEFSNADTVLAKALRLRGRVQPELPEAWLIAQLDGGPEVAREAARIVLRRGEDGARILADHWLAALDDPASNPREVEARAAELLIEWPRAFEPLSRVILERGFLPAARWHALRALIEVGDDDLVTTLRALETPTASRDLLFLARSARLRQGDADLEERLLRELEDEDSPTTRLMTWVRLAEFARGPRVTAALVERLGRSADNENLYALIFETLEARMTPPNLSKVLLRELARCSRMSGEVLADRLANEAMVPALAECLKAIVEGRISDVAPVYAVLSRRLESGPRADLLDHLKRHWDELPPGPAGFDARMDLVPVLAESGDPDLEARLMDLVSQAMSREAGALTDDLQLIQDELAASAAASLVEAGRGVEGLFAMLVQHQVDVGLAQVAGEEPGDSEDLVVAVLAALTQTGFDAGEDDHLRRVWEALPPMSVALVPARLFASWAELSGFRAASPFLLERLLESTQTLESINPVRLEALALGMPAGPENDLDDLVARALRCAGRRSGFQVGRLTAALFWGLPLDQMPPGLVEGLLMAVDPPDRLSFSDERPPVELRRSEVLLRLERTLWERGRRDEAAQVMRGLLRDHGLSVEVLERFVDRAPSAKQAVLRQGFEAMAEGAGADSLIGPPSRWRR